MKQELQDTLSAKAGFVARLQSSTGETLAVRIVDDDGAEINVDVMPPDGVAASVKAAPLDKKDRELLASNILIQHLNRNGAAWQPAEKHGGTADLDGEYGEVGVDCVSRNAQQILRLQVTMADRRRELWQRLRLGETVEDRTGVDQLADRLLQAVESKRTRAARDVVLLIDATQSPYQALDSVVLSFRLRHGMRAAKVGFNAIWLVGPTDAFVFRLDQPV